MRCVDKRRNVIQNISTNIYVAYTCLFMLVSGLVFGSFILTGKSFLWYVDGAYEHYTYLIYMGEFLRKLVSNIVSGNFVGILDNWDFSLAQGGDAITSLHYFALGDPLGFFAIFFSKENIHILYNLLVIVRFWLAGAAFVFYSRKMNFSKIATLAGAFVYCFSGYAQFSGVRHPFFLNPMIWLPIIAVGVEEILERRRSKLFIFSIMMSLLSNFYFFYSITVLMAGYFGFRFLEVHKGAYLKKITVFIQGIWRYCLGVILALPLFLPVAYCLLNSARFNYAATSIPLYFDKIYYLQFFLWLVSPYNNNSYYTMLEYSGIVLFCLIALYFNKGNRALKAGILTSIAVLWIPYACYLMNAKAYITNRWTYGLAFLIGIAVVKSFDLLFAGSRKAYFGMIVGVGAYFGLTYCVHTKVRGVYTSIYIPACVIITIMLLLIFLFAYLYRCKNAKPIILQWGLLVMALVGIVVNGYFRYSSAGQNYVEQFVARGEEYEYVTKNAGGIELIEQLGDNDWYRIEFNYADNNNEAVIEGYNGTRYSLGLMPKYMVEYLREMQDIDVYLPHYGSGLDDRTYLEALAGVKYYVRNKAEEGNVPYGYSLVTANDDFQVYENEFAMPLGVVYDKVISNTVFDEIDIQEKQQVLLNYLVLPDDKYDSVQAVETQEYFNIPYEISCVNGNAVISDGCIEVIKDNAEIELKFEGIPNCETYLKFMNMAFEGVVNTAGYIDVISVEKNNKFHLQTPKAQWYFGFDNFFCNMGYSAEAQKTIKLEILRRGKYSFDELQIICLPMDDYTDSVQKRMEKRLHNVEVNGGNVKGTIEARKGEWLFLSIPYSVGWSAFINGEEVEIERANYVYQAIQLENGLNVIEMRYRTPGLLEGICIAGVGCIAILIYLNIVKKIRRKR